jgi:hypothetical protein
MNIHHLHIFYSDLLFEASFCNRDVRTFPAKMRTESAISDRVTCFSNTQADMYFNVETNTKNAAV